MSIDLFFPSSKGQRALRVGPLACKLDGFAAWLATQGYARETGEAKLRVVKHLGLRLENEGLGAEALDEECFERFLGSCGPRGKPNGGVVLGRELLAHLRREVRIPDAPEDARSTDAIARIERTYEHYLVNERGLSPSTVGKYLPVVRAFLTERFGTGAVALETLLARDASRFIVRHSEGFARSHAKDLATALRSFLRHLHQRGDVALEGVPRRRNPKDHELASVGAAEVASAGEGGVGSGKLRPQHGGRPAGPCHPVAARTARPAWRRSGQPDAGRPRLGQGAGNPVRQGAAARGTAPARGSWERSGGLSAGRTAAVRDPPPPAASTRPPGSGAPRGAPRSPAPARAPAAPPAPHAS